MGLIASDSKAASAFDLMSFVTGIDFDRAVSLVHDQAVIFLLHRGGAVICNRGGEIVQDRHIHIFLGLNKDLFRSCFIFKPEFVKPCATFGRIGFDSAFCLFVGQSIRDGLLGVVHAAGDQRTVWIPFKKTNHYLLTNTGNEDGAPGFSGPALGHAYPA